MVELDPDHPGFRDSDYRERRNRIAEVALAHTPGAPVPDVDFLPEEHAVWRKVWEHLDPLHDRYACAEYLAAKALMPMDRCQIPQLSEINQRLKAVVAPAKTMALIPVAGLVTSRAFLGHLSDGYFLSTQYIRHHSVPLYTPEPDIVHELVGHACTFAVDAFVELNTAFGIAALNASEQWLAKLTNLYWWTLEFGVVYENGEPKAYGAGLLSSFGELERLPKTPLLPLDFEAAGSTKYDPTGYQPALFAAESFRELRAALLSYLRTETASDDKTG